MRLTPAQEERYARHLLLDELGGEGQERLLAAAVRVRGEGQTARWAARYLAASGVGRLYVESEGLARECRELGPDSIVEVLLRGEESAAAQELDARVGGASEGARAALEVVARLCGASMAAAQ